MRLVAVVAAFALVCIVGLGFWVLSDDDSDGGSDTELAPPPETADAVPKLPRGWTKTANAAGGFAIGVPPGWSVKANGSETTLRSPGSIVIARVTADRTDEALEADLDEFAAGIASRISPDSPPRPIPDEPRIGAPGYEVAGRSVVGPPGADDQAATKPLPRGTGKVSTGQRYDVVVVRRVDLAAYPVLIATLGSIKRVDLDPIEAKLVSSLRGQPVTPVQE